MADKKKVVRRTTAERMAALEQELADLERIEVEKAKKKLVVKNERLAKVVALITKYDSEQADLVAEIEELETFIGEPEQAEEVTTSGAPFSVAG